MTKYILHGGNTKELNEDNNGFFREMTLGLPGRVHVLLNYFSRLDSEIEECAKEDKRRLLKNSQNKDLSFEIADPQKFIDQLKKCNIMYMRGGDSAKLIKMMSPFSDLKELFKNKVIVGSSAGVYVMTRYYWENDTGILGEGLGILNFKVYCHYNPNDINIVNKLQEYKENLPLLTLPNCKWVIFYQ